MINKLKSIEAVNYFYIGWIMMVFHFCVANSNANTYSTSLVSYIALLFFLSKIFLQKNYKSTQIVKMIITVVLGFLKLLSILLLLFYFRVFYLFYFAL